MIGIRHDALLDLCSAARVGDESYGDTNRLAGTLDMFEAPIVLNPGRLHSAS